MLKYALLFRVAEDQMMLALARMDKMRIAHKILVKKPEGKRSFERMTHAWKDNIKTDVKEIVSVWVRNLKQDMGL
jgi:hypothetical protein